MKKNYIRLFFVLVLAVSGSQNGYAQFSINNSFNNLPKDANIEITFSSTISTPNASNVIIHSSFSGEVAATFSGGGSSTLSIDPNSDLVPGEKVKIYITSGLGVGVQSYELTVEANDSPHQPSFFQYEKSVPNDKNSTRRIVIGDINGDNLPDIITPVNENALEAELVWQSGANNHSTNNAIEFGPSSSTKINDIVLVDLDLDGDLDIVVSMVYSNATNDRIMWLRNNGSAAFTAFNVDSNFDNADLLDVADIDGDGLLDVICSASFSGSSVIQWFKYNGGTSFTEQGQININDEISDIYCIDLEQDGDMDFVASGSFLGNIYFYENDGSQSFAESILSVEAGGVQQIYIADMDDDNDYDVLSAVTNFNALSWHINNGTNSDWPQQDVAFLSPSSIDVADLDGDGLFDLLTASNEKLKFSWFNQEEEVFIQDQLETSGSDDASVKRIIHTDYDNDGDLDIIAVNDSITFYESVTRPLEILSYTPTDYSNISQEFEFEIEFNQNLPGTISEDAIRVKGDRTGFINGTFEGLGTGTVSFKPDNPYQFGETIGVFVNSSLQSEQLTDLDQNSSFEFIIQSNPPQQEELNFRKDDILPEADFNGPRNLYVIDIDKDGDNDILAALFSSNKVSLLRNPGDQLYVEEVIDNNAVEVVAVAASDLDKDGFTDIFSLSNTGLAWYENDQNGGFNKIEIPVSVLPTDPLDPTSPRPSALIITDLTGDSWEDIIIGFENNKRVLLFTNQQDNTFIESFVDTGGFDENLQTSLDIADVDLDGDIDILSTAFGTELFLRWYVNDGDENFTENIIDGGVNRISNVKAADIDGDGDIDIIRVADTSPSVTYWENDGDNNFNNEIIVEPLRNGPENVEINDINGDGLLDIVTSSFSDDAVYAYLNSEIGEFERIVVNDGFNGINSVLIADIEQDGDLDILSTELLGDKIDININSAIESSVIEFSFPQSFGETVIDQENLTINSIVGSGSDLDSLIADFTLSYNATASVEGLQLESGVTVFNYSNAVDLVIRGEDPSFESIYSLTVDVLPDAPVIDDVTATQTKFTVFWSPVGVADSYLLDLVENGVTVFNESTPVSGAAWSRGGLTPGTAYTVSLKSVNTVGVSTDFQSFNFVTIPDPPIAQNATGVSEDSYFVNWVSAKGASGYKIEVAVDREFTEIRKDTTIENSNATFAEISSLMFGTEYFYRLFSLNGSGISQASNIIEVETKSLPVQIVDLTFSALEIDQDTSEIEFRVIGGPVKQNVIFSHSRIGENDMIEDPVSPVNEEPGNNSKDYLFKAPASFFDDIGMKFKIIVRDDENQEETDFVTVGRSFNANNVPELEIESVGGEISNWQIISIPYKLENNLIESIFDEFGALRYRFDWRLMHYRNGTLLDAGEGINTIDLGRGYWFNAKNLPGDILPGAGQTNDELRFLMVLGQNWNQIGNPYNITISWDQVLEENEIFSQNSKIRIFDQSTGTFFVGDSLEPFSGGFVYLDQSNTIEIDPEKVSTSSLRIKKPTFKSDIDHEFWKIPIYMNINKIDREIGSVGMHPDATILTDQFDELVVPRFFNYNEFYTIHNDYTFPKFQADIVTKQGEYSWSYILESNIVKGSTSLRWDNDAMKDARSSLWLVDELNGKVINMKSAGEYHFRLNDRHEFTIHYSEDPEFNVTPKYIILGDAYPNPASERTTIPLTLSELRNSFDLTIEVYDTQGKRVQILNSGTYKPGFYEVEWDIDRDITRNGVYILKATFDDLDIAPIQKKIMIIR